MVSFIWREDLNTGINEIDDEHRHCFDIINRLSAASSSFADRSVLLETFTELTEYLKAHFSTEEKLMMQYYYPKLQHHKELHGEFIQKLIELYQECMYRQTDISISLLYSLQEWLIAHIKDEDTKYIKCVNDTKHVMKLKKRGNPDTFS